MIVELHGATYVGGMTWEPEPLRTPLEHGNTVISSFCQTQLKQTFTTGFTMTTETTLI